MDLNERLEQARTDVCAERDRTDGKASALLGALGIPLAVLVAAVPGHHLCSAAATLVGLGAAGLLSAMVTVLLALRPRLTGAPHGSFLHWADCAPAELADDLLTDRRAQRVITLAAITRAKFRALAWSVSLTIAGLACLTAALLVSLT